MQSPCVSFLLLISDATWTSHKRGIRDAFDWTALLAALGRIKSKKFACECGTFEYAIQGKLFTLKLMRGGP